MALVGLAWLGVPAVGADGGPAQANDGKAVESSHMEATTEHKHTNLLIHATSPYLLQHAHNPVDWYE